MGIVSLCMSAISFGKPLATPIFEPFGKLLAYERIWARTL